MKSFYINSLVFTLHRLLSYQIIINTQNFYCRFFLKETPFSPEIYDSESKRATYIEKNHHIRCKNCRRWLDKKESTLARGSGLDMGLKVCCTMSLSCGESLTCKVESCSQDRSSYHGNQNWSYDVTLAFRMTNKKLWYQVLTNLSTMNVIVSILKCLTFV